MIGSFRSQIGRKWFSDQHDKYKLDEAFASDGSEEFLANLFFDLVSVVLERARELDHLLVLAYEDLVGDHGGKVLVVCDGHNCALVPA